MSFLSLKIDTQYQTTDQQVVDSFLIPTLSEAKRYCRVSAYFSLKGIQLLAAGLEQLACNDGRYQLLLSSHISETDFDEIKQGYEWRNRLREKLQCQDADDIDQKHLGLLAKLIAEEKADVKIAFLKEGKGIFHDKFGLLEDSEGNKVLFSGFANESTGGLSSNYESIIVDVSWDESSRVRQRLQAEVDRFGRLWSSREDGVITEDVSDLVYEQLAQYQGMEDCPGMVDQKEDSQLPEGFEGWAFIYKDGDVWFIDTTEEQRSERDRHLRIGGDWGGKYFKEHSHQMLDDLPYAVVEQCLEKTRKRAEGKVAFWIDPRIEQDLKQQRYSIEQYRYMGVALKENVNRFEDEFALFRNVISESVSRPLKTLHLQSAFYMYKMARAANFSVPGAGKTAMVLGVFAYLNSGKAKFGEFVSRILVVSPINAFESWKSEFQKTFGPKKKLRVVDVQDGNFDGDLRRRWAVSNLVLVNYESLPKYHDQLIDLIDGQTMIVFDEVHRIKGVNATRATAAMDLCDKAFFRYVLTGTPIPNSYCDIYNFLHLLYKKEYPVFFGWDVPELSKANQYLVDRINEKLYPFFWRTNKGQLGVPPADPDDIIEAPASSGQLELALAIWTQEKSSLAKLIRLMQASTNPSLLKEKIDFRTLGLESNGEYSEEIDEKTFNRALMHEETAVTPILSNKCYEDFDLDNMKSPKFEEGLKLIRDLVNQGKKVIVWGLFVNTLQKISSRLDDSDIDNRLIYGETPVDVRKDFIADFRNPNGPAVLVSNPQTLGESVSLQDVVHDAVYFEFNFNLTYMLQSRDRIHRLGLPDGQYTRYHIMETINDPTEYGFIDSRVYKRLKYKERRMREAIDGDVLKPEVTDDLLADVRSIIENERRSIAKAHAKTVNVEIE